MPFDLRRVDGAELLEMFLVDYREAGLALEAYRADGKKEALNRAMTTFGLAIYLYESDAVANWQQCVLARIRVNIMKSKLTVGAASLQTQAAAALMVDYEGLDEETKEFLRSHLLPVHLRPVIGAVDDDHWDDYEGDTDENDTDEDGSDASDDEEARLNGCRLR
jgi:hypothetical protein